MSNLQQVVASNTLVNAAIADAAELACVTVGGIQVPTGNAKVFLIGWLAVTPPGSTTSIRARIERGAAAGGTTVADTGLVTNGPAAGAIGFVTVMGMDTLANVAGGSYTLTVLCTAGSGAGTVNFGGLLALLLT